MDMESAHPIKARNQLRRANKLVDVIDTQTAHLGEDRNRIAVAFAQGLSVTKWADVALLAGISAPSITTVTMAITILENRVVNDEITADKAAFACFTGSDR